MNKITIYDNKNHIHILDIDWSRKQNRFFSNIHGISSYLAMFCPAMPSYFIEKYSNIGDTIMDNFSGRGTTALVAREKQRKFVGNDLNPYAYVLSRFKVSTIRKNILLSHLNEMQKKYLNSSYPTMKINKNKNSVKELLYFYSDNTYRQLLFLRDTYGKSWQSVSNYTNAVLAFALGIMHGPSKKNGDTIYFSLKMPNTISMSPNYVKNYALQHNLIKPNVNIFEKIKDRINKKFDPIFAKKFDGKIYLYDSIKVNKKIVDDSISLVITSPPYMNIVNYTRSNWLKLWLLGYERNELSNTIKLSDNLTFDKYCIFIEQYLKSIYHNLKTGAKVCLIVGDVFNKNLIVDVWNTIKKKVSYNFLNLYIDNKYMQNHKITNMLNSRTGNATKVEKILVLEKR